MNLLNSVQKRRGSITAEGQESKERTWRKVSDVKRCLGCNDKFTLTNRKHHCRSCGEVFCGKCSAYQVLVDNELKRACLGCYKKAMEKANNRDASNYNSMTTKFFESAVAPQSIESTDVIKSVKTDKSHSAYAPWADVLIHIRLEESTNIVNVFPEQSVSESMLKEIISTISSAKFRQTESYFTYRTRDKTPVSANDINENSEDKSSSNALPYYFESVFYNCYAYNVTEHRKKTSNTFLPIQHTFVLVSRWPFPMLAYRILNKTYEYYIQSNKKVPRSGDNCNFLLSLFGQIMIWPNPQSNSVMYLPFAGEMYPFQVPIDIELVFGANIPYSFHSWKLNIVSLFGPLGLLQHIWLLWEAMATSQNIVVYATNVSQCSSIIFALLSLLSPVQYVGDVRPFLAVNDSDMTLLRKKAMDKYETTIINGNEFDPLKRDSRRNAMIVGITDINALKVLEHFDKAVLIPPCPIDTADNDSTYLGMRKRHSADVISMVSDATVSETSAGTANSKFSVLVEDWLQRLNNNVVKDKSIYRKTGVNSNVLIRLPIKSMILCRNNSRSSIDDQSILEKCKAMESKDRLFFGETMFREQLKIMTRGFFKSSSGQEAEEVDIECAKSECARIQKERAHKKSLEMRALEAGSIGNIDELGDFLTNLPEWLTESVPRTITIAIIIMATLLMSAILSLLGISPTLPLTFIIAALMMKADDAMFKQAEGLLKMFVPENILYPGQETSSSVEASPSAVSPTDAQSAESRDTGTMEKVDLSGIWKRVRTVNYENFMGAQGANFVQKKLAASIVMVHTITMDKHFTVLRLQEKGGPIDVDNMYYVHKDAIKTSVSKKQFMDKAMYDDKNVFTIVKTQHPEKDYEIQIRRYLENNGNTIRLVAVWKDLKGSRAPVETTCYFEKQGASPQPIPESYFPPGTAAPLPAVPPSPSPSVNPVTSAITSSASDGPKVKLPLAFSGVWQRSRSQNIDAFFGAQGAGYLQRKLAATITYYNTISISSDQSTVKLLEKGGPLDNTSVVRLENGFVEHKVMGKIFLERMFYINDTLVFHRVMADKSYELVIQRRLQNNGQTIYMSSLHRDLKTLKETEGFSWFNKTGPAPACRDEVPVKPVTEADQDLMEHCQFESDADANNNGSANDNNGGASQLVENDDDDDDTALEKMRQQSTATSKRSLFNPSLYRSSMSLSVDHSSSIAGSLGGSTAGAGIIAPHAISSIQNSNIRTKNSLKKFEGKWGKLNNFNNGSAQEERSDDDVVTITIIEDDYFHVRLVEEVCGDGIMDHIYTLDETDCDLKVADIAYQGRIFLEGFDLVEKRTTGDFNQENTITREIESNGNMRVITTVVNRSTGEESESIALFRKK